jgi:hypothetical protein
VNAKPAHHCSAQAGLLYTHQACVCGCILCRPFRLSSTAAWRRLGPTERACTCQVLVPRIVRAATAVPLGWHQHKLSLTTQYLLHVSACVCHRKPLALSNFCVQAITPCSSNRSNNTPPVSQVTTCCVHDA